MQLTRLRRATEGIAAEGKYKENTMKDKRTFQEILELIKRYQNPVLIRCRPSGRWQLSEEVIKGADNGCGLLLIAADTATGAVPARKGLTRGGN